MEVITNEGLVSATGNRVELKQNNRYVVLTFILVGTIAGVVLAVVTIYLIKRHSRSRHKLQQLASNPDGNEASKDYQDLCRQRMQGKTSEKPEPLHAASRIGSVSEAQVRSPSSRSSTSSW
ncbi:receptor-type tyrosine-protein phosphatase N2 [Elysia marginata]|uniref:Receptor-type tyrosine-protein phosphatase N2 n=1 Tax=Elysia marginata TaxID=1093978 RepID=A0AAV4IEJ3_9GAST|nr:receptor-type tyrosine-protein phosphatase N2 [Elysia marginata]